MSASRDAALAQLKALGVANPEAVLPEPLPPYRTQSPEAKPVDAPTKKRRFWLMAGHGLGLALLAAGIGMFFGILAGCAVLAFRWLV